MDTNQAETFRRRWIGNNLEKARKQNQFGALAMKKNRGLLMTTVKTWISLESISFSAEIFRYSHHR